MICSHCGKEISDSDIMPLIITTGEEFEEFLFNKINAHGGCSCEKTKASGDQGVDLIVQVRQRKIAIQCKLYSSPVGNEAVQQVVSGRLFYKCDEAVVVTNNTYTQSAKTLAEATGVTLLHYTKLLEYLDKVSGAAVKRVHEELEKFLNTRDENKQYEKELNFVVSSSLEEPFSIVDYIETSIRAIAEASENNRKPMNVTMWFAYSGLIIAFKTLSHDDFDGLVGKRSQLCEPIPITEDVQEKINIYKNTLATISKSKDYIEKSIRAVAYNQQFNISELPVDISSRIEQYSAADIQEMQKACLNEKEEAKKHLQYLFGVAVI